MCVFVCVRGWGLMCVLIIFYSPQAHMKRDWDPLLPQTDITEQCECKRQIVFENPPEPTFCFESGTE